MNSRSLISPNAPVWNCSFSFHAPAKLGERSVLFESSDCSRQLVNRRVTKSIREDNRNVWLEFELFTMTLTGYTLLTRAESRASAAARSALKLSGKRLLEKHAIVPCAASACSAARYITSKPLELRQN